MENRLVEPKEVQKTTNPYAKSMLGKFCRCNQPRHGSNKCHNRKVINFVDNEVEEVHCELDGDKDNEGQYDYGNGDEQNYVNRKLMLSSKQQDVTQCQCTINGRIFDLIIDNGSYENIISKEVIKALQ